MERPLDDRLDRRVQTFVRARRPALHHTDCFLRSLNWPLIGDSMASSK